MKHVIIGTAGHIDHGKTALIKALTGRDTDRLKEEKQRGITIDLGFTWFDLKDGTRCGIVDVPGHEKLISNMTAGVVGMDLVLMVIAADEGIMPQTREHLDILELLGVRKTILVLNKCDLVDAQWLEMAEEEIRQELKGTIMEDAPLVRVSAVTGEGVEHLKDVIADMVKNFDQPRDVHGLPRLPVDRVFTMPGFGTIVTGTLISGTIVPGDTLEIYPSGRLCRVRGLQIHGRKANLCEAGQRAALNIDTAKEDVSRGCVIAPPGSMKKTDCLDVRLQILPDAQRIIRNRSRLHLYTGTSRLLCRAVLLDEQDLGPGESGYAQLLLEEETAVKRGDRFIVRFYSPVETIGGGVILDTGADRHRRFDPQVLQALERREKGSLDDLCALHVSQQGENLITQTGLAAQLAHTEAEVAPVLEELEKDGILYRIATKKEIYLWDHEQALLLAENIRRAYAALHAAHPYRIGLPKEEIRSRYMKQVKTNVFDACLRILEKEGQIESRDGLVRPAGVRALQDDFYRETVQKLTAVYEEAGYHFLRFDELSVPAKEESNVRDILGLLTADGILASVTEDVWTVRPLMTAAEEAVRRHFETEEVLTYTQVREMFGTSRKCARMLMEYTDRIGLTRRAGPETERVRA